MKTEVILQTNGRAIVIKARNSDNIEGALTFAHADHVNFSSVLRPQTLSSIVTAMTKAGFASIFKVAKLTEYRGKFREKYLKKRKSFIIFEIGILPSNRRRGLGTKKHSS